MLTLWNTYSFWVLYANASDELGRSRLQARRPHRPRPLGALPPPGDGRDGARAHGRLRLHHRRAGDRRVRRGALQLVRAAVAAALLGRRRGRLRDPAHLPAGDVDDARPVHPVPRRRDLPQPRRAAPTASSARRRTRSTCATSRRSTRRSSTPSWKPAMAAVQRTVRLGHAARSAGKVKVRQPLRRAVIVANEDERASIEALADLVTAELNVKELDFVSEEGELVTYTVKPNYRTLGPRFGKHMPQVAAAVAALDAVQRREHASPRAARSASRSTASTTRSAPTTSPWRWRRWRATRSRPRPATRSPCSWRSTRSSAARASPGRSSAPSRTRARTRASRSPTGSRSGWAATPSCSRSPASTRPTSPARPWRPTST